MSKKLIFVFSLIFIISLAAQTSSNSSSSSSSDPSIKEQATGIKHTLVEDPIEIEIQKRVEAEIQKRMNEEFEKRVKEEVEKRMAMKKHNKVEEKVKTEIKKNVYISTFKETQYAEELFISGKKIKARSVLEVLINDRDKKLAEEAHFLLIKWFSDIYIPVMQRSGNYNKVLSYENNLKESDNFKKEYPKSKYLKELNKTMKEKVTTFNSINKMNNFNLVDIKDSCVIEYKGDSTYICTFKKSFKDKANKEHELTINVSGKVTKYDPYGDLQDDWDTSGLLIDDNSLITITLDKENAIKYEHPIEHKQSPEYELRRVVEYGFSQNKTCVKEHKVEDIVNIATYLTDNLIVSNLEIKTHFGRMNDLASMDVIYAAKPNGNFFSDRFKSKCSVELTLNEVQK